MKHFPAQRSTRYVCLECGAHRDQRGPSWRLFWRTLGMGVVAMVAGLLLAFVFWHSS